MHNASLVLALFLLTEITLSHYDQIIHFSTQTLFRFGLMVHTLDVKTSQYTSVLMYHYVGIHEAAECFSGTKSRTPLNSSKGRKLHLAHDDCLKSVSMETISLWSMSSPVNRGGSAF